jgi:hypothetical protein
MSDHNHADACDSARPKFFVSRGHGDQILIGNPRPTLALTHSEAGALGLALLEVAVAGVDHAEVGALLRLFEGLDRIRSAALLLADGVAARIRKEQTLQ